LTADDEIDVPVVIFDALVVAQGDRYATIGTAIKVRSLAQLVWYLVADR
jgi:hypothetical protein